MSERDDRIYQEAAALWRQLYGQAPPGEADAAAILDGIVNSLPSQEYERLSSPFLRPSEIAFPKRRSA